jgi:hypothetical protein
MPSGVVKCHILAYYKSRLKRDCTFSPYVMFEIKEAASCKEFLDIEMHQSSRCSQNIHYLSIVSCRNNVNIKKEIHNVDQIYS